MKGKFKFRILTAVLLVIVMIFTSTVSCFAASKTKSMTVYDEIYKSGDYAYCNDGYTLYRVNLKTNAVKRLTTPCYSGVVSMKLYKGYLYYISFTEGTCFYLKRVKAAGGSRKTLTTMSDYCVYAISNSKIYYKTLNENDKTKKMVMNLDGKSKKSSSYNVKNITKKRNVSGYKIVMEESYDFDPWEYQGSVTSYLEKPNGDRIKLSTHYGEDWD